MTISWAEKTCLAFHKSKNYRVGGVDGVSKSKKKNFTLSKTIDQRKPSNAGSFSKMSFSSRDSAVTLTNSGGCLFCPETRLRGRGGFGPSPGECQNFSFMAAAIAEFRPSWLSSKIIRQGNAKGVTHEPQLGFLLVDLLDRFFPAGPGVGLAEH